MKALFQPQSTTHTQGIILLRIHQTMICLFVIFFKISHTKDELERSQRETAKKQGGGGVIFNEI